MFLSRAGGTLKASSIPRLDTTITLGFPHHCPPLYIVVVVPSTLHCKPYSHNSSASTAAAYNYNRSRRTFHSTAQFLPHQTRPTTTAAAAAAKQLSAALQPALSQSAAARSFQTKTFHSLTTTTPDNATIRTTASPPKQYYHPYSTVNTKINDKMAPNLDGYFSQVDALSDHFIDRLSKAVAIPSVSADPAMRPKVVEMGEFLAAELKKLGVTVELRELGEQPGHPGLNLPPIVLGRYGNDSNKRTILVYGHYDVQPAQLEDGWATDPFKLTVDDKDRMFGRGSTDDKGPVLGWLNAIEAHQKAGVNFPVNLLMCFEGMEEYGSEGLDDLIVAEAKKFFKDADAVCISDNYWLGTEKPCLTYGLRGCSYYSITVSGPGQDLHSGVFGGTVTEPMTDLVRLMATLVDNKGKIQVPGLYDLVAPITEEEKSLYGNIAFNMNNLYESLGSQTSIFQDTENTLMGRWRNPSLSLHGIEGAFSAGGAKTVIPAKVVGKFSIRTVPNMEPKDVDELVFKHVNEEFKKLGSNNNMKVELMHAGKWWVASPKHWNFEAAKKATEKVWGVTPDFTREGGSIPVTLTFEQATGKNVLLLPMGSSTDAAHSINEKLDKRNYIQGTKLLGAYLHYVAEEPMA